MAEQDLGAGFSISRRTNTHLSNLYLLFPPVSIVIPACQYSGSTIIERHSLRRDIFTGVVVDTICCNMAWKDNVVVGLADE